MSEARSPQVVLYFLHDVLVPAVSRSAAAFLAQSSGRVAEWAGERMRLSGAECAARPSCGAVPFLARGTWLSTALTDAVPVGLLLPPRGPLREPASPFPADQTVRFGAVGALRALNAEGGVFATGSLLRRLMRSTGGRLRFTGLDQLPIVRRLARSTPAAACSAVAQPHSRMRRACVRLPAISLGESSLRVTPASLAVGGLDTVSSVYSVCGVPPEETATPTPSRSLAAGLARAPPRPVGPLLPRRRGRHGAALPRPPAAARAEAAPLSMAMGRHRRRRPAPSLRTRRTGLGPHRIRDSGGMGLGRSSTTRPTPRSRRSWSSPSLSPTSPPPSSPRCRSRREHSPQPTGSHGRLAACSRRCAPSPSARLHFLDTS